MKDDLYECLKDGIVLCSAMNTLKPNCIKKYHKNPKMAALQIENIGIVLFIGVLTFTFYFNDVESFLRAAKDTMGIKDVALFRANDLFEQENMTKVCTYSLLSS